MKLKAQTPVLSYVLVLGIVMASVSAAYLWGVPLLKKGEASSKVELAKNSMLQLKKEVDAVVTGGGQRSITMDLYGLMFVSEPDNSVYYSLYTERAPYTLNVWIPLTASNMFGVNGTQEENSTALLGMDEPSVLLVRVERAGDGFLVTYRLALRELDDSETATGYLNQFMPMGNDRAEQGRHTLTIRKGDSKREGISKLRGTRILTPIYVGIS